MVPKKFPCNDLNRKAIPKMPSAFAVTQSSVAVTVNFTVLGEPLRLSQYPVAINSLEVTASPADIRAGEWTGRARGLRVRGDGSLGLTASRTYAVDADMLPEPFGDSVTAHLNAELLKVLDELHRG